MLILKRNICLVVGKNLEKCYLFFYFVSKKIIKKKRAIRKKTDNIRKKTDVNFEKKYLFCCRKKNLEKSFLFT